MTAMFTLLLASVGFFCFTLAVPEIAFPINSQVPPLAQVAEPFAFQFSDHTFISTNGAVLSYTIQGGPSWLSLDTTTRTFKGTATVNDVGNANFQVVADDSGGHIAMSVTLVVTNTPAPRLATNITDVLSRAGPLSDLQSLAVYPKATFSIAFPSDTFAGSSDLSYYATSADRSPLPSWIRFNPTTLALSGITPPPVPNPLVVPVRLIASDVAGFEGQSILFNIVISDHRFVFASVTQDVSAIPGQFVNVGTGLQLDGIPAPSQVIASVQTTGSDWLHFDPATLSFSGHVPPGFQQQNVQLVASDIYNDNAYTYLNLGADIPEPVILIASSTSAAARSVDPAEKTATAEAKDVSSAQSSKVSKHQDVIVVAIVVPIVIGVVAAILLGIMCLRRRKQRQASQNYVDHFASKSTPDWAKHKEHTLSMAIARTSPMGSPEQRHWDSQEHPSTLRGLGLSLPRSAVRRSISEVHPLRSNAIPAPPKRSSKRQSKYSPQIGSRDGRRTLPSSRRERESLEPVVHGARVQDMHHIPKCAYCHSDNVRCLDCGRSQLRPALDHVKVQRRSQIEPIHQYSVRKVIDDSSIGGSSFESDKERERREAEEYVNQPLEKKFKAFRKVQREAGRTRERFSNSGSGSSLNGVRRWHSSGSIRGPNSHHRALRCFSDNSMRIPEESVRADGRHVIGKSQGSDQSWITEGLENSDNTMESVIGPRHARRDSEEVQRAQHDRDYGQMLSGVRMADGHDQLDEAEATEGGTMEEYPSSELAYV